MAPRGGCCSPSWPENVPLCSTSGGSETLLRIRSLAGSIIDTLESSFQKRQAIGEEARARIRSRSCRLPGESGETFHALSHAAARRSRAGTRRAAGAWSAFAERRAMSAGSAAAAGEPGLVGFFSDPVEARVFFLNRRHARGLFRASVK